MSSPSLNTAAFKVLLNHEEQYSMWSHALPNPLGWRDAGKQGTREECLAFVREVWTDMRPLSLRLAMQHAAPGKAQELMASIPAPMGSGPGQLAMAG